MQKTEREAPCEREGAGGHGLPARAGADALGAAGMARLGPGSPAFVRGFLFLSAEVGGLFRPKCCATKNEKVVR